MKTLIFVVATFVLIIASIATSIARKPIPQELIFESEAAFIASLQRYTTAYQSLTSETERQYLADAYLKTIIKHAFVLPAANDTNNIQVILSEQVEGQRIAVLKEIQLGPDNGLYEAMYRVVFERHRYKPPFYSEKLGTLLEEILRAS